MLIEHRVGLGRFICMPNNKYQRSVKRERQLVNEYAKLGWTSFRTASSKSKGKYFKIDVGAINLGCDNKTGCTSINLHQIKTEKNGRKRIDKILETIKNVAVNLVWTTWENENERKKRKAKEANSKSSV